MKMCFKGERDRDFLQAYHEALRSFGKKAPFVSRTEVIRKALNSGSPRFYVTYEEARRNVRRLMNNRPISCRNRHKLEMYHELTRLVEEYMKRKPRAVFNDALFTILAEYKAPRFYMGEESAQVLLYKLQKRSWS